MGLIILTADLHNLVPPTLPGLTCTAHPPHPYKGVGGQLGMHTCTPVHSPTFRGCANVPKLASPIRYRAHLLLPNTSIQRTMAAKCVERLWQTRSTLRCSSGRVGCVLNFSLPFSPALPGFRDLS